MMNLMQALRCHRTAKRLSRYVDMDPTALLSEVEIERVRKHLAECEKCTSAIEDLNKIKSSLRWLGASYLPSESSLSQLKATLTGLAQGEE
jgi:hypothetical protein